MLFGQNKGMSDREALERSFVQRNIEEAQRGDAQADALAQEFQDQRSDFLRWTQDLDDRREYLKYTLKGFEPTQIADGNFIWEKTKDFEPLCNDIGLKKILLLADGFFSKNLINSNFDTDRVLITLRNSMWNLVNCLASEKDTWKINSIADMNIICETFKISILPGPFRAYNDGERKHSRTIAKVQEVSVQRPDMGTKQKKILGIPVGGDRQ